MQFIEQIQKIHEGIYVHSIYVDEDSKEDQRAGWFGNVTDQVDLVAHQLACIPELAGGFDAIGFSQGGQFLRSYVQFYNQPPVHNLITYGSQHMGISDLPGCARSDPLWCSIARSAARLGVYSEYAQENLVQAQYYRDVERIEEYLTSNTFLTRLNAEVEMEKNETKRSKENLSNLENLVLVLFTQDTTVVPKESAWFGSYAVTEEDVMYSVIRSGYRAWPKLPGWWPFPHPRRGRMGDRTIIPMRMQPLYEEDLIGLKTLDEAGKVHLESCDAAHMHIKLECWEDIVLKYVGGKVTDDSGTAEPSPLVLQGY